MVQNVKTGRDVVMNFWLLDVVCNVVEEVCWYWQIIIFNHGHHYFYHVFPPCCQGSRCWWKTSWRTSQPPLQSVIGGGLKIENCLISLSHVSKQIWHVQLSSSTAAPPTLHYLSWLLVHHQSHHKRGPTIWEKKMKRSRKGMRIEDWQQQPTPPASSCPPNYCASLGQSTRPHPAERSSHTCDQKSNMITALTKLDRVSQKKRTFRMLQSVLGSKTLSGHNDRNLRMRTWVRSAVFVPRTLCSILRVRFFWDTLYVEYAVEKLHLLKILFRIWSGAADLSISIQCVSTHYRG